MYAYYEHPVDECVAAAPTQPAAAPEIAAPAPPAAAPTAPDPATASQTTPRAATAITATHHTARRGWIVVVHHARFHTTNHAKHRHSRHWLQLMARYHHRHHHA